MKLFWSLVALLLLASAGLLVVRARSGAPADATMRESALPGLEPQIQTQVQPPPAVEAPQGAAPVGTSDPQAAGDSPPEDVPSDGIAPPAEPSQASTQAPAAPRVTPERDPATAPPAPAASGEVAPTAEANVPPAAAPGTNEPKAPADAASAKPGELLLNGRYAIPGEGTEASPYVVSWETLTALESEYDPKKEGMKQVPEWIKALDGKHVTITGFIAFPFIAPSAEECMVMLNQWDGCCIGVPPTPYDAVEVKLASPLDLQQGVINYGTISGVFRTDPYLVNGWLIGLYVMDDATVIRPGGKDTQGF